MKTIIGRVALLGGLFLTGCATYGLAGGASQVTVSVLSSYASPEGVWLVPMEQWDYDNNARLSRAEVVGIPGSMNMMIGRPSIIKGGRYVLAWSCGDQISFDSATYINPQQSPKQTLQVGCRR